MMQPPVTQTVALGSVTFTVYGHSYYPTDLLNKASAGAVHYCKFDDREASECLIAPGNVLLLKYKTVANIAGDICVYRHVQFEYRKQLEGAASALSEILGLECSLEDIVKAIWDARCVIKDEEGRELPAKRAPRPPPPTPAPTPEPGSDSTFIASLPALPVPSKAPNLLTTNPPPQPSCATSVCASTASPVHSVFKLETEEDSDGKSSKADAKKKDPADLISSSGVSKGWRQFCSSCLGGRK